MKKNAISTENNAKIEKKTFKQNSNKTLTKI